VAPFSYNYGVNIVSQNGNVVANGQNVGTVAEYSQQAFEIANTGVAAQPAATDQWLPLGVFAMVRNEQQQPHLILQFAINRQGILRGNYTDDVSGRRFRFAALSIRLRNAPPGPWETTSKR
jgi:hypothetical protein